MKQKLIVGVTGSFGTGKSTVAGMFKDLGACVIDADRLARKTMLPGAGAYKRIVSVLGKDILKKDKSIDRTRLAGLVFSDKKKLMTLNSLIHPPVISEIRKLAGNTRKRIVVIDAPLLVEAGLVSFVDKLVVVKTDRRTRIKRCLDRGFSRADTERRVRCQLPLAKKLKAADFIIDNSGAVNLTGMQVRRIWEEIKNGKH